MPDYSKSVIYIIKPNVDNCDENDVYYGSTTNFIKRCGQHISKYNEYLNNINITHITYYDIYDKYDINNCKTEIIENYSCNTKEELLLRERYYIDNYPCINKMRPIIYNDDKIQYRNNNKQYKQKYDRLYQKQYRIDNHDKILLDQKQYRQNNNELIKENNKNYRENHKSELNEFNNKYYDQNKDQLLQKQKEYYQKNKKKISEQKKQYYNNNKDNICKKNIQHYNDNIDEYKQQYYCKMCECYIRKSDYSRHCNTKKHIINFINY